MQVMRLVCNLLKKIFADNFVIWGESGMQVEENLNSWRSVLERRGMKLCQRNTEYMKRGTKVEVRKVRKEQDLST